MARSRGFDGCVGGPPQMNRKGADCPFVTVEIDAVLSERDKKHE